MQHNLAVKANAVAKLTYLQMLGYDVSWAGFNIIGRHPAKISVEYLLSLRNNFSKNRITLSVDLFIFTVCSFCHLFSPDQQSYRSAFVVQ
jgi:hypothetical protein